MLDVSAYIREGWLINALTVCVSLALREGEGQLKEEQHCTTASIIIITHHWTQSLNTHTQAVQPLRELNVSHLWAMGPDSVI